MFSQLDPSADYYLYYRDTESNRTNHIATNNQSICSHHSDTVENKLLTSFDEISVEEWSGLLKPQSDLCSFCRKLAVRVGIVPEQFVEEEENQIPDDEVCPPVEGYHVYYRTGTSLNPNPRDHIVDGGEALCNYGVNVSTADSLKPVENVSTGEWSLLLGSNSNLCGDCWEIAEWKGIFPEDLEQEPEYECPLCEEPAKKVDLSIMAYVHHSSETRRRGPVHKVPREHYEEWRRNQ